MSGYLPDGCSQDALDRAINGPESDHGICCPECQAWNEEDCQCCRECGKLICVCEDVFGTEKHSDRLEREARDRANAGDWEKEARDDA